MDHKFYGAAFALVRPTIEAVVRAHVVLMCSDEVSKQLRNDEYRTNLATVGMEIDAAFHSETPLRELPLSSEKGKYTAIRT